MIGIYKITSPKNKIYIGQSTNIEKRFSLYKICHCKQQPKLYNSLLKYTPNSHLFEILTECCVHELDDLEKYFIKLYDTFNTKHGLNLQDGGSNGRHSDLSKMKMSKARKGMVFSEETKIKMSNSSRRLKTSLGKKMSEDTKNKLSVANKGKKLSRESIEKRTATRALNKSCVGRKHSEETKNKMSKSIILRLGDKRSGRAL